MLTKLHIESPKRSQKEKSSWTGFFPYYAGFPESFARKIIASANLPTGSIILDPWNGSGTTTYAAATQGIQSIGLDINPAMTVVAKARLLPTSEADSIAPLGKKILQRAKAMFEPAKKTDPLTMWFGEGNAGVLRSIEMSAREHLVGSKANAEAEFYIDRLSCLAAMNYVALFSVSREMASPFKSSNPTWLRYPRRDERKPRYSNASIYSAYLNCLLSMAAALQNNDQGNIEAAAADIRIGNSTCGTTRASTVDFILTSPPYCTRIDYTAATRIELAVLSQIRQVDIGDLGRQMIGSTRVPIQKVAEAESWGNTCISFLNELRQHPSKASGGYYYFTHLDYFDKMGRSLTHLSKCLKPQGTAILVVQDSFYKEIYNDLPKAITEMAEIRGLKLFRRDDFRISRTMAGVHPYAKNYAKSFGATEAVLCFEKI